MFTISKIKTNVLKFEFDYQIIIEFVETAPTFQTTLQKRVSICVSCIVEKFVDAIYRQYYIYLYRAQTGEPHPIETYQ